jgi:hypothetical protein
LYNSLKELKKIQNVENLCLYYVVEYKDEKGNLISDEIIKNGANRIVTDIEDFIQRRIEYIEKKNKIYVNEIKNGLFNVLIRIII